ncbi:helix-turn-helix domain-containing protein [Candidatus Binatus soli]|jgi:transcriptional regulator with XRE-family HTH domain|uniref:helix-turn-helix domain-containing protein n=1 Tax=Candidatus Binatus soli TaxID=1953413 RepID=UPI003D0A5BDA
MDIERLPGPTEVERFERSSTENRRLLRQEELILEVTEALSAAIQESGLTRSEVAKRLGKTKGFISQLLAGGRNLTLRTVADVADAVGVSLTIGVESDQVTKSKRARQVRPLRLHSWPTGKPRYSIRGQIWESVPADGERYAA